MRSPDLKLMAILGCICLAFISCSDKDDYTDHIEFTKPMLFRPDSSYYTCVKYVPDLDQSPLIKGNAYINIQVDGYGFACYNFTDTINWKNLEFWASLNENMGASYCKLQLGRITLGGSSLNIKDCIEGSCSLSKWNQDIPLAKFDEDPDKWSWLEITSIDTISNYVEGEFQFHFVFERQDDASAPSFAHKISYVNGAFRAKANF